MKLELSGQIFEKKKKNSNIKFSENPSSVSLVVPYGQAYVDEVKNHFSQFCERFLNTH